MTTYFICIICGSEVDYEAFDKRWRCSNHACENNLGQPGDKKHRPDWVQLEGN